MSDIREDYRHWRRGRRDWVYPIYPIYPTYQTYQTYQTYPNSDHRKTDVYYIQPHTDGKNNNMLYLGLTIFVCLLFIILVKKS